MHSVSVLARLRWAFVAGLLLPSATAAGASSLVVQQIGDAGGRIAEAVAEEAVFAGVAIVPFSPRLDARATPIILATGKVFLGRDGKRVLGLRPAERSALRRAYDAGQVILLLDVSTHDIEALHVLLEDGVAHESSTDPVVLAYALRQENRIPTARLVTHPVEDDFDEDDLDEDELALSRALEIVIEELTRPPAAPEDDSAASSTNWGNSPVQKTILELSRRGTYNTPVEVYALHSCQENMDYYLVNTGGTWTPMDARYESASRKAGEMRLGTPGEVRVDWQPNNEFCNGGLAIFRQFPGGNHDRICRYVNYPQFYQVDILPPSGPRVVQVNAAPAGDQGKSASYQSGFSFSIGGGVEVTGKGPSAGFQAGVTWDNSVSTTVPPLVIEAGNQGNQGTFTRYRYCTVGDSLQDCASTIQMTGAEGSCREFHVGAPQNGQTPNGRLSNVAQTVNWRVDPGTYTGSTFDITVRFQVELTTSTSRLWVGGFAGRREPPAGYCNPFGCSCGIESVVPLDLKIVSHTFKVPFPSTECTP
jgi:hypothetical protein